MGSFNSCGEELFQLRYVSLCAGLCWKNVLVTARLLRFADYNRLAITNSLIPAHASPPEYTSQLLACIRG